MTISVEHRGRVYTWTKPRIYSTGMGLWRTDKGNIVRSRPLKAKLFDMMIKDVGAISLRNERLEMAKFGRGRPDLRP